MITFPVPHTARYFNTNNTFTGTFNVPTVNKYDFSVAANQKIDCFEFQKNVQYLIERISIGGNIGESDFNDSIDTVPELTFKTKQSGFVVYEKPFYISNYFRNQDISNFVSSDVSNDYLTLSLSGILSQIPATIGKGTIKISVSLSVFAIDNNVFNKIIREGLTPQYSERLRS